MRDKRTLKSILIMLLILLFVLFIFAVLKIRANSANTSEVLLSETTTNMETVIPTSIPTSSPTEYTAEAIDFNKSIEEFKEDILVTSKEYFEFVKDMYIEVDETEKEITFSAVVNDSTDKAIASDFADTMIRRFGLFVNMNGGEYEEATQSYYGGLYDEFNIMIGVAQESKTENTDEWYVYQAIAMGTHQKVIGDN